MNEEGGGNPPSVPVKPFFVNGPEEVEAAKNRPMGPQGTSSIEAVGVANRVSTPTANAWGGALPHMTGAVFDQPGQHVLALPVGQRQKTVRWFEFIIGMVLPAVVMVALVVIEQEFFAYQSPYSSEVITVQSDDGRTFDLQFPETSDAAVSSFSTSLVDGNHDIVLRCIINETVPQDADITQRTRGPGGGDAVVGTYFASNNSAFFQLDGATAETLDIDVTSFDSDYDGTDAFDGVCCAMPFVYFGSVVVAFVRGRRALGAGLIAAIPFGLVTVPFATLFALVLI